MAALPRQLSTLRRLLDFNSVKLSITTMGRRVAPALDRATVLREAFALLDEKGLSGLSLRSLATRLGVQAPAFYWHFSSKAELLGHMSAAIYLEARTAVGPCGDWPAWLLAYGRALRQRLSSQRDAGRICATAQPLDADASITAAAVAEPLTEHGLDEKLALDAIAAVTSLAIGWNSYEPGGSMRSFLEGMIDFDESFEVGLEALITGFKAKARANSRKSAITEADSPLLGSRIQERTAG